MTVALTLALVASACIRLAPDARRVATDSDQVTLSASARSEGVVVLRLINGSSSPIGYNLCASSLERMNDTWTQADSDIICTMELRILSPGASATFDRELSSNITPGEYRFRTGVESPLGTSSIGVVSNTISIQ